VNVFPRALFKKYKTKEEATVAFFGTADKDVNLGDKGMKNHGTAEKEVASFKSKDVMLIVQSIVIMLLVMVIAKLL